MNGRPSLKCLSQQLNNTKITLTSINQGKIFFLFIFSEGESNSLRLIQRITNSPAFSLPEIPVPALPEPESKFLVSVPLTPRVTQKSEEKKLGHLP